MPGYENFEAVSQLDTEVLRNLLADGDPQERVWAAWAVALELGADSLSSLREAAQASPTPGTRRHLVVILAGLGERKVLCVFAESDPDAYVRATACQYLMRTWSEDDLEAADVIRQRLLTDGTAEVKETILKAATSVLPPATLPELAELTSNRALEVRRLAFELIKRRHAPKEAFGGVLAARLHEEPDRDLLVDLANFCIDGGQEDLVLRSALRARAAARALLLEALHTRGRALSWAQARPLAELGEAAVDLKLLGLLEPRGLSDGFPWLVRRLAESIPHDFRDPELMFFSNALTPLAEVIDTVPAAMFTENCRRDLESARSYLNESIATLSEEDPVALDDYGWAYTEEIAFYQTVVGKIDAALNRS
jgi:hypothetical protein